ncbi:MAG: flavodoxin family protein [Planctomycetaceae bacterium]|jgi:multimeric flavodoxin WrbA|nr:flavodoxin family protein [Planctomycetaceae bacterium]
MKVLAINGSPKPDGNTATALKALLNEVETEGIETELITLGSESIHGCIGCCQCMEKQDKRCSAFDDAVNELMPKLIAADALVLGSPVYFSGINGTLKAFLDRAFFVAWVNGAPFRLKPGVGYVAARRSGGTAAFEQLNKYFQISEMPVVSSCYWNVGHGFGPGEIRQDGEGLYIARTAGRNLAWLLKLIENGKGKVSPPKREDGVTTNFVR